MNLTMSFEYSVLIIICFSCLSAKPPSGTPAYRSQEEYYEQVLDLKKVNTLVLRISFLMNIQDSVKSKLLLYYQRPKTGFENFW